MASGDNFDRATWKDSTLQKLLLDFCIDEMSTHGRQGGSLKKESWAQIQKKIVEKLHKNFSQKQLKNGFDYLKRKYQLWVTLINRTGNGYNPSTGTMDWSNDQWEEFLTAYPNAKVFMYARLQFADECRALFGGVYSIGEVGWTPLSNRPRPMASTGLSNASLGTGFDGETIDSDPIDIDDMPIAPPTRFQTQKQQTFQESIGPSERPSKRQKKFTSELDAKMEKLLDIMIDEDGGPTVEECVQKLDDFGWTPSTPLYIEASVIFAESLEARKEWICWCGSYGTPNNEAIKWWISA
ncbi:PREDICTED: uncharacterized protein LOC104612158 [Nelumbo nucifera]|uniref:Uncharacterized protein LOC104612158 n=2 Tax=Nelumbo nucifera TaxID=4432 RepID=A0A1U8BLE7_NELNU|nr:PREDICTED: uncharacterized protein LOC104612158 [Nelumbo nucifera]DAD24847.1 TPA_asm: hypothetical protein HUJ06_026311 [Nelumbo nucifera]